MEKVAETLQQLAKEGKLPGVPTAPKERITHHRTIILTISGPDAGAIGVGVLKALRNAAAGIMQRHNNTTVDVKLSDSTGQHR